MTNRRRKRGSNEGSIYRRSDGRWAASVSLGWRNGKRWRKYIYGKTRREVADRLNALLRDKADHLPIADPKGETVASFLNRWLHAVVKRSRRPKTYVSYADNVRLHIIPALGRHKLEKLKPEAIQQFVNDKLDSGLSARTVEYLHAIVRSALKQAIKWRQIKHNPACLVEPPQVPHPDIHPFTVAEAQTFLGSLDGHRMEAFYSVGMALGLRLGEALALPWERVGLEKSTLTITRAVQWIKGKRQYVEPKNERGRRTIPIPETVRQRLIKHQVRQDQERQLTGSRWKEHGLVFPSSVGTPMHPRNVLRHLHETLKVLGIPRRRLHDMRHTSATFLLAQGVPVRVVMHILGHSQVSTTLDIYGHVLPEMAQDAMNKLDEVFDPVAVNLAVKRDSIKVQ